MPRPLKDGVRELRDNQGGDVLRQLVDTSGEPGEDQERQLGRCDIEEGPRGESAEATGVRREPENAGIPLWVDLVATIPTMAVFLVPCAAAVLYGGRVNSLGDRRGLVRLCIGALAGLGLLILSIVTIISSHL